MLIDRTRSTLHPGDIKKVRKTNLKGNQMPEQGHRFISYPSIKMKHNGTATKKIDELDVEFTHAIAKYKNRTFAIQPLHLSCSEAFTYEIYASHPKLEGQPVQIYPYRIRKTQEEQVELHSMKEAIEAVQDFISKELK